MDEKTVKKDKKKLVEPKMFVLAQSSCESKVKK